MASKKVLTLALWLSIGVIAGCAAPTPLTPQEQANLDYGSYPTDFKQIIDEYLNGVLKDPYSKKVDYIRGPGKVYNKPGLLSSGQGVVAGYGVCASVNAKNSYGGYTGSKLSFFMIRDGRVIGSYIATTSESIVTMMAENGCKAIP